ncbi:MAG: hypothetical protein M0R03_18450, partial [Novosphingobium sp.]|nr:hypothetical protein [Novosphingobium sp.]
TNNNQEVSNEINGIFSIKPPGMNFVLPPYNVWSPHELYEDFDGKLELKWEKSIPGYAYEPSGQFKLHMTDDIPIYGNMLVFNPPKNIGTTTFNTIDFTRHYVPGYHIYKLWVRGFDVDSDIAELRVKVLESPVLSETRNKSNVFYINEYDELEFRVSGFNSTQTLRSNEKIIMRLTINRAGVSTGNYKDFNYSTSGIYHLKLNDFPSSVPFSKTKYTFRCQFFKLDKYNSSEYDRSNPSNTITIGFKERFRFDMTMWAEIKEDAYDNPISAKVDFIFVFDSKIPVNYKYKMFAKNNSGGSYDESRTYTGAQIRSTPGYSIDFPKTTSITTDRNYGVKVEIYDLNDNFIYNTNWYTHNCGKDSYGPYTKQIEWFLD